MIRDTVRWVLFDCQVIALWSVKRTGKAAPVRAGEAHPRTVGPDR